MTKYDKLQKQLKYQFKNQSHLITALTHKSFHFEAKNQSKTHNEVLEFLGDAVLGLIISEFLIEKFPQASEGDLSKMRSHLVSEARLAKMSEDLGIAGEIRLGKGERQSGGDKKPRLLASTFEAVVGALFLDAGYRSTRARVRKIFNHLVEHINPLNSVDLDFKTRLQEFIQKERKKTPVYQIISEQGPAHNRTFEVKVLVQGVALASGMGRSKKLAEQDAAKRALTQMQQQGRLE